MFKKIFVILIALIPLTSFAKWTYMAKNDSATDDQPFSIYMDLKAIRKDGNLVKVWVLNDHAEREAGDLSYMSMILHQEYDCTDKKVRTLSWALYTGPMGEGEAILSSPVPAPDAILEPWEYITSGTIEEVILDRACLIKH